MDLLVAKNLASHLQRKVIVSAVDAVEFEHAWKNRLWHVYEPISFDLSNADTIRDKARRWVGQLTTVAETPEPFRPHFVVGKPSMEDLLPAYDAAIKILGTSPVTAEIVEENDIERLVDEMEKKIRDHGESQG